MKNEEILSKSFDQFEKGKNLKKVNHSVLFNAPVFPGSYYNEMTDEKKAELDDLMTNKKLDKGIRFNVWLSRMRKKLDIEQVP
jgi:hypothetical protein